MLACVCALTGASGHILLAPLIQSIHKILRFSDSQNLRIKWARGQVGPGPKWARAQVGPGPKWDPGPSGPGPKWLLLQLLLQLLLRQLLQQLLQLLQLGDIRGDRKLS